MVKLKNVQLNLMMGPATPTAVSRAVLDSLAEVELQVEDLETSGFRLKFSIQKQSPVDILFLLAGGAPLQFMRVVLVVTVNGVPSVLMDGVITHNEFAPGDQGSNSTLTLMGKDLTALMDQDDRSAFPFPGSDPEGRVKQMLAKYAVFGIKAQTVSPVTNNVPPPRRQIPGQRGTDLQYIRSLALQVGYVFYLEPGPAPGTSKAYWGPQIKVGPVQPALSMDMDAYTNVESLSFSLDQERNRTPLVFSSSETGDTISVSLPPTTVVNPKLGQIPPQAANVEGDRIPFRDDLAKLPAGEALMKGLAAAARNVEVVTCEGSLDITRYGGVLKPRQLVGVRGCRPPFDGLYYVKSVTHKIKRGEYKQTFSLTRNGLGATVQKVNV